MHDSSLVSQARATTDLRNERRIHHGSGARHLAGWFGPLTVALLVAGCVPHQTGTNQCPELNHAVTVVKDGGFGTMPAAVDLVVADYLSAEGAPPGCAVGIMQGNQVAFLKGYGIADLDGDLAFTHTNASVVGSVSKTWTALAVLRLMEMGYLDLDDPISNYLETPPAWEDITIRQLLSHSSGLQRDPTFHPLIDTELELSQFLFPFLPIPLPGLGIHPAFVYYSYQQTPIVGFEPGATAEYSNTGYMILGALIDQLATDHADEIGEAFSSYEAFVWRHVGFFNASLSDARQMLTPCLNEYWRQTDIPQLARGYTYTGSGYVETVFSNSPLLLLGPAGWEGPPGGWTVTIGDLVRLMVAIESNTVISNTTRNLEMMQSYGQTVDDNGNINGDWGLGVGFATKLGRPVYLHDGKYPGYRARYTVWPGEDFGVAIMANESEADMRSITDDIAAVFIGASAGDPQRGNSQIVPAEFPGTVIDDNDPGLGGELGRNESLPFLTDRERRAAWVTRARLDRLQLIAQERREQIATRLENTDSLQILERFLVRHGPSLAVEFAQIFDAASTPGEGISRSVHLLNQMVREGKIGAMEREELQRLVVLLSQAWQSEGK